MDILFDEHTITSILGMQISLIRIFIDTA